MNRQAVAERQLVGESDKAIDCLEKSITHGCLGTTRMDGTGRDLAPVCERPRFRAVMEAPRDLIVASSRFLPPIEFCVECQQRANSTRKVIVITAGRSGLVAFFK